VATILVTLFSNKRFSLPIILGPSATSVKDQKTNVLEACSVPITRVDVVKTHNSDRAGHQNVDFNQSLMWPIAQKSLSQYVHCTSFRSFEIITVHKLHNV
jgi:hypothetical protein